MRQLKKIVFINSATIRYEEVLLDGNVHFIGTQGVGKSTGLKAIISKKKAQKLFHQFIYVGHPLSDLLTDIARNSFPNTALVSLEPVPYLKVRSQVSRVP